VVTGNCKEMGYEGSALESRGSWWDMEVGFANTVKKLHLQLGEKCLHISEWH